jgi:hypothetical protein
VIDLYRKIAICARQALNDLSGYALLIGGDDRAQVSRVEYARERRRAQDRNAYLWSPTIMAL